MSSGARTFGLDETLIEPQVLPPPPTRHALFIFLVVLASILHIGTAGWSEIHNGVEGSYASAARAMVRSGSWIPPHAPGAAEISHQPPLLLWLLAGSFQLAGSTAAAARFPIAAATILSVALTFLIGERLAGYWRGFIAGLLHLCCLGTFIWGRIVSPAPVFAALLGATVFCALCGYQRARGRRAWFAGAWVCMALAVLTVGLAGLLLPAAILLLLALFFREARLRFRLLLDWRFLLLFLALALPWHLWIQLQSGGALAQINWGDALRPFPGRRLAGGGGMSLPHFLFVHLAWWFPLLLLVLPALLLAPRRIFRPHEFEFSDAVPLAWIAVGFLPLLFASARQDFDSLPMWGGLALASAWAWDRAPRSLRLAGVGLTLLVGIALAGMAFFGADALPVLPPSPWPTAPTVLWLVGFALIVSCLLAGYFARRNREELAIAAVMLGMVTIGLGAAETMARSRAQFSLAEVARLLQTADGESEVLYEGSPYDGSSLWFYLERPPLLVAAKSTVAHLDPLTAMEKMGAAHPVYLVIHRERVPFWQEKLTERFHLYHQIATSGPHVVIDNQP